MKAVKGRQVYSEMTAKELHIFHTGKMQFTYISTKHPMTTSLRYLHSTLNGQGSDKRNQSGAWFRKTKCGRQSSLNNKYTHILTTSLSIRHFLSLNLVNLSAWVTQIILKCQRYRTNHDYLCKMEIGVSHNLKVMFMIKSKQLKWSNCTFNRVISI
jgi:hypothetical protein